MLFIFQSRRLRVLICLCMISFLVGLHIGVVVIPFGRAKQEVVTLAPRPIALPSILQRELRCMDPCQFVDKHGDCRDNAECLLSIMSSDPAITEPATTAHSAGHTSVAPVENAHPRSCNKECQYRTKDGYCQYDTSCLDGVATTPRSLAPTKTDDWKTPIKVKINKTDNFDQEDSFQTTKHEVYQPSTTHIWNYSARPQTSDPPALSTTPIVNNSAPSTPFLNSASITVMAGVPCGMIILVAGILLARKKLRVGAPLTEETLDTPRQCMGKCTHIFLDFPFWDSTGYLFAS